MPVKNILVPLDGSANSFRGLDMAVSIAKPTGASITIVHAMYEPSRSEFRHAGSISKAQKDDIEKIVQRAEKTLESNGIPFKTKVVYGNTGYNILKLAHSKAEKIDMIIIGSRGRGSIKEMFFGSTSNYVIHSSKIPVLIVK